MGDAIIKNRDVGLDESLAKARKVWEEGHREYPNSPDLQQRLELMERSTDELIEFVEKLRGLEDSVDTDLAKVWVE